MVPWKNQQMSPNYLLITSIYPWKLLVAMNHDSTERTNETIEVFITCLLQAFFTVISMEINGDIQKRHLQNYIDANSTFNYTIPHLIFHGMMKIPASMISEPLDVIYT